jgi:4-diphosphocytidyl-2-C-methyl-D-erythritol kinase
MLCFPFAKINLGLSVLKKRTDNFHNIESLLVPIKLYDILEIIENPEEKNDELMLSGIPLDCSPKKNLVWKVLQELRKSYDFPCLKIHLHKQIPVGSGLGGGSSDAAHALLAINQLFKLNIDKNTLEKLASKIGSDCPFFLNEKAQYVKGKGEIVDPFELKLHSTKLLLIIPDFSVSTSNAYAKIKVNPSLLSPKEALQKPIKEWKKHLKNDFENPIFNDFPLLKEVKERLYKNGAIYASLSGSGSALFGLFSDKVSLELPNDYQSHWLDF